MTHSYLRCTHCRGFYPIALSHCWYCGKDIPQRDGNGDCRVFPNREICRALQIAEFEQLPKEAHDDCFQPDPAMHDALCYCLHCGPDAPPFEAIEMRWHPAEKMWACPCTTCGGRGFNFDIHLAERWWQCSECKLFFKPADGDYRGRNAKCPKCGGTYINGCFDDDPELQAEFEAEYEKEEQERLAKMTPEERAAYDKEQEEFRQRFAKQAQEASDELPWDDDENADTADPANDHENSAVDAFSPCGEPIYCGEDLLRPRAIPDDIEFPRPRPPRPPDDEIPGTIHDIPF